VPARSLASRVRRVVPPEGDPDALAIIAAMAIRVPPAASSSRLDRLALDPALRPIDIAESFRDLPALVLLESARPGRSARWSYLAADPLEVIDRPSGGSDPFTNLRAQLARMAMGPAGGTGGDRPPFTGGLVGYLGYDLGRRLERLPSIAVDDQDLPVSCWGLYDWVLAFDRRTGAAWLGGRVVDGDTAGLDSRLADVRARLRDLRPRGPVSAAPEPPTELGFHSGIRRAEFLDRVESVRDAIARGEIYQANLSRRLETPFDGDPWLLYRRLRTGDPALFSGYLDLGVGRAGGPRAVVSASPEPFLAVSADGRVTSDPIKGTRPRGTDRAADRALARELLASDKDRAENVMIVDVLRNDLGRVCSAGTVRVPRLCRLERTAAVQHLVSTVTGRLAPGRDAFDLLAAAFPGGSITGAPKIRAMELLERLEPVRRGPYTGSLGWIGPDGAMRTSILIRTFVADGRRLTLHVGGGVTWRSDPVAEWDETVAKAAGPLGAIGGHEADR
jgi:para-aminobenzoate synthetase component 1